MKICLAVLKLLYADILYKDNAKPKRTCFQLLILNVPKTTQTATGTEEQASYFLLFFEGISYTSC
jgi:hypothetical protein